MRGLARLMSFRKTQPPASETPFYAIGDVHGCYVQLQDLLAMLDPDIPRVFVGDYVDRGPETASVLRALSQDQDAMCLLGNHEVMMLKFLEKPARKAKVWLKHGGTETLESFGVTGVTDLSDPEDITKARDALRIALGPTLLAWLERLATSYQNGNVAVVHAGADPARPIKDQDKSTLVWGHKDFATTKRKDGMWVLHGHTVVPSPTISKGRIAIDTGAYATGRLTAALVTPEGVSFLQTGTAHQ